MNSLISTPLCTYLQDAIIPEPFCSLIRNDCEFNISWCLLLSVRKRYHLILSISDGNDPNRGVPLVTLKGKMESEECTRSNFLVMVILDNNHVP